MQNGGPIGSLIRCLVQRATWSELPTATPFRRSGQARSAYDVHAHHGSRRPVERGAGIRGLRIPVATVVGMTAEGMTADEILDAYPDLELADVQEALHYAAEAVRERELPLAG
jgi:uncharacterized protein (DUF433 family)